MMSDIKRKALILIVPVFFLLVAAASGELVPKKKIKYQRPKGNSKIL
jgi:hypothetical protein